MSTSQIVRALQAAGLLERREHDEDSRAKTVEVTSAGREKARAAIAVVEKTDEEFFAPVGASTAGLVKFLKLLAQYPLSNNDYRRRARAARGTGA
jgi:DNA-binding MarR family transcriptional regulator